MAVPKPEYSSPALQYAGDASYSAQGDARDGTPTKVTPTLGIIRQGARPGRQLPSQYDNWVRNQLVGVANAIISHVLEIDESGSRIPALNWSAVSAMGVTPIAVGWSDAEQAWYALEVGTTSVRRSTDYGKTWNASGALAVANNGGTFSDVAFDTAGNVCFANSNNVYEGPLVAYGTPIVWTKRASVLGGGSSYSIVFEPVSGNFCVVGQDTNAWLYTSSNRATWTARTLPGTWTSTTGLALAIGAGNGLVVVVFRDTATNQFRTARSANGGVTWTNDQAIVINAGITFSASIPPTRPVFSAADGLWYVAVSQGSPRKTQVFSSPDAITWTSASTLLVNDCRFVGMQCLGSLLVGLNDDGRVFCSVNKGVSWFRCGATLAPQGVTTINNKFKGGGNGLLIVASTSASATTRYGMPATPA